MDYEKIVLVCEDSMEGIFTSVYEGWRWALRGKCVEISVREPECPDFFTTVIPVLSDSEKAGKVLRTVQGKLGAVVYEAVCYAAVSTHPQKGTLVFQVLWQALSGRRYDRRIMENLADPNINLVSKIRIRVWHELHRYYGFVRFQEIGDSVLFSRITPENDILEMLAPHFENRFPNENWMIYDERRQKALLHPKGGPCTVRKHGVLQESNTELSYERAGGNWTRNDTEGLVTKDEYEELWRSFCKSITIQERRNPGLQQQLLPLKFRSNMPEFQEKA